jgi:hypothetical protein
MMAIDDLLDRGRDARRRRDQAASELAAVIKALDGLAGVDLLDATQNATSHACAIARAPSAQFAARRPPTRSPAGEGRSRQRAGPSAVLGPAARNGLGAAPPPARPGCFAGPRRRGGVVEALV